MTKFEKQYVKVMKQKEEITPMVKFLVPAMDFIVSTGKLAEFESWKADRAMESLTKKGGEKE